MNNSFLKSLYNTFKSGCVIFTILVFVFYILGNVISSAVQVLTLFNMFLLLLFSIWFALANYLLNRKSINIVVRVLIHFLLTVVGFFVIFIYMAGNFENKSRAFIITVGFAVLYIIIAAITLFFKNILKKKDNDKQKYESVYDDQNLK